MNSVVDPRIRPVLPVGVVRVSSGVQLHSSVPKTSGLSRVSVDPVSGPKWLSAGDVEPDDAGVPDELPEHTIHTN